MAGQTRSAASTCNWRPEFAAGSNRSDHVGAIAREAYIFAWEAMEQNIWRTAGSSSTRDGERMQRMFRDMAMIAGHRNSHSAPFHDLGALATGDSIVLIDSSGRPFTYTVTEMFVVNPDAMWITEQSPGHTLTIFTCHPIGSSAQGLVMRATLA